MDLINKSISSPAFIYDEHSLVDCLEQTNNIKKQLSFKFLFSIKAFSIFDGLNFMSKVVDGFGVSSLFEARLAREVLGENGAVHIITPGFKQAEIDAIIELCDFVTFNSLPQWDRFLRFAKGKASCGLRINPQLSFVEDSKYNPCRKNSKLGVPLDQLLIALADQPWLYEELEGLHFHSNSESESYTPLLRTVLHLDKKIPKLLSSISWMNLGGGYFINDAQNMEHLEEAVGLLKNKYNLDVFMEPGQGVIEEAGVIVSSVIDLFESDGENIAILDTTVNHMPEVFEYQYKPEVLEESANGAYKYILGGCTCLAGDLFGDFRFDRPLKIGDRLTFKNMGAYTLVKANMFNGVNLPTIYVLTEENELKMIKQFDYQDFKSRLEDTKNVIV